VAKHQLAVGRGLNVHLDEVGAQPDGFLECRNGVLGMVKVLPTVRDGHHVPRLTNGRGGHHEQKQKPASLHRDSPRNSHQMLRFGRKQEV